MQVRRTKLAAPLVTAGVAWAALTSQAQAQSQVASSSACAAERSGCFTLLGVTVDGATALSAADLANTYTPYLARQISGADLTAIADAITARYRDEGYFLSRAIVPAQDNGDGLARIAIYEGKFSEVVVEGSGREKVLPYFDTLGGDRLAKLKDLDRALALAGDLPGVTVRARVEPVAGAPTLHKLVVTADFDPASVSLSVDNRGPDQFGPVQAAASFAGRSLFLDRDQASLLLYTTPQHTRDFSFGEAQYGYTFANGDKLYASVAASRSQSAYYSGALKVGGLSRTFSARYQHPFYRRRDNALWLEAVVDARHIKNDWLFGGEYQDEMRVARLNVRGLVNDKLGGASTFSLGAAFGTDSLGGSGPSTARRSRQDADAAFTSYNFSATHLRSFTRHLSIAASAVGQYTEEPLLLSEEFDAGSYPYGRAYGAGEISGDRGVAASMELRASVDPKAKELTLLQGFLFADTAHVWNFNGAAKQGETSIASAGGGVRLKIGDNMLLGWEAARPLESIPFGRTDRSWRNTFSVSVVL